MTRIVRILVVILPIFLLCISCDKESKVEKVVKEHLNAHTSSSTPIKIERIEVIKDTLPVYLDPDYADELKRIDHILSEKGWYSTETINRKLKIAADDIKENLQSREAKEYNIALAVVVGEMPPFGEMRTKEIFLLDADNPEKVLYTISRSEVKERMIHTYEYIYGNPIPRDEFKQIDPTDLPAIPKFILSQSFEE